MTTSIPVVASAMLEAVRPSWRRLDDVAVLLEQPAQGRRTRRRIVLDDEQMHLVP